MTGVRPMRIVIVDDHALFTEAIALALEGDGHSVQRLEVGGEGTTPATVLSAVLRAAPRAVLLDLDLGRIGDGMRLIKPLAAAGVVVIVVTGSGELAQRGECLRRGARAVLVKTSPLHEMVDIVRRVRDGRPLMDPHERDRLIDAAMRERDEVRELRARFERLTRREAEVMGSLMRGSAVREIARSAVVSEATVRTQVKASLAKLEMSSQLAAVGVAYKIAWRSAA